MYLAYSFLTAAGVLLLTPYLLVQGVRHHKYLHNWRERLGLRFPAELNGVSKAALPANWVHAVSVGETLAAVPFARALKERFPARRLVFSTTTATGMAVARERMTFADAIFYFPLDWAGPVRRALQAARPALVVIFETEIWPNFLHEARRAGVPVVFVNGRLSDRSFARYKRALRWPGAIARRFLRSVLGDATLFLMQSDADAERLVELGAPAERVKVMGNVKYDLAARDRDGLCDWLDAERQFSKRAPLLVAGSVVAGEEEAILEALTLVEQKWPAALLVFAPRKPERFEMAFGLIEKTGRGVVRRSTVAPQAGRRGAPVGSLTEKGSVFLLDSIGELAALYQLADVVFIGGALVPSGGHNPLEPAAAGKVPVFGPFMDNFREIASTLLRSNCAVEVHSGAELGAAWLKLLGDAQENARMGRAARDVVERNRGATRTALDELARLEALEGQG
jgi:3-deoxy-D-manno-octulosonic-acid transferase